MLKENYKTVQILKDIYEANNLGVWFWCEGEKLRYKSPEDVDVKPILNKLRPVKDEALKILKHNELFDDNYLKPFIYKAQIEETELSNAQERLWFIDRYKQGTNLYNVPFILELSECTIIDGIKSAIQKIVKRHEILRSTIEQDEKSQSVQIVHDEPVHFEEVFLEIGDDYDEVIAEDIDIDFNLNSEYPIKVKFYFIKSKSGALTKTLLLINFHHIAVDGWSVDILQKELTTYYEAYAREDIDFDLPPLEIQYKDYAIWQKSRLSEKGLNDQLSYWKEKLSGFKMLEFPTDYARPAELDYRGSKKGFSINKEISAGLRALASKHGTTLHTVMLSSLGILLSKYSYQEDIIIGSLNANRQYAQTRNVIGFFVNTQLNRLLLNQSQSYEDLILETHKDLVSAQQYQDLPFEYLIDELGVERDFSRHPIFQVLFGVQSFGDDLSEKGTKGFFQPYNVKESHKSKFDLSILIDDSEEELSGNIGYATSLFNEDTITRLIGHYKHLLSQLVESPQKLHSELSLLQPSEYDCIVNEWNKTEAKYPSNKTLIELFKEQVAKTPNNVALVCEGDKLSYSELNEKSNQLAHYIRSGYQVRTGKELGSDTLIGLYMDRSLEMVIGVLAVLKAGGAYVPLSPDYPQERIGYILEDSLTSIIVTEDHYTDRLRSWLGAEYFLLSPASIPEGTATGNLEKNSGPKDLAYVIYTSGTTGKPKGVMIEQKSVANLIEDLQGRYGLGEREVILQFANYVFDVSVKEIFLTLLNGHSLHLLGQNGWNKMDSIVSYAETQGVTHVNLTPSTAESLDLKRIKTLRCLNVGGEALSEGLHQRLKEIHDLTVINSYGPTETTISSIVNVNGADTSIGRPIQNTKAYVLDMNSSPVPVGVVGELYLGGAGLARGYLNNGELTSERFIANPFATEEDEEKGYTRLYRTGDLVRWLPDGNLEYLGRNDDQVKIRGYRIELGEVEHSLSKVPGIKQCCVLALERKLETGVTKYLAGYYVLDEGVSLLEEDIRRQLSEDLPDYMVPMRLVKMESFSLTMNGKLDKHSLPEPDFDSLGEEYVAPTNEFEILICKIWEDVLGLERVGVQDDFLKIGGNSILAIRATHLMSESLDVEISIADLFKYKTPSRIVDESIGRNRIRIPKVHSTSSDLSFSQERLWFIEQYEKGSNAYHIPAVFELGSNVDKGLMKQAIQRVVDRHEVLRSTIEQGSDQRGIQVVHEDTLIIEEDHVSSREDALVLINQDINRPFDLSKEYPLRVKIYEVDLKEEDERAAILLMNMHHIASDGWSINLLRNELIVYYEAYVNNKADFDLPPLEIQYKDYAVWQRGYLSGEVLEKQLSYWKKKLSSYTVLELSTDFPRPKRLDYKGSSESFTLDKQVSTSLRTLANRHGTTLHTVMLSGLGILLSKYANQDDIVIGSPIANRQYEQTKDLVGFFVNTQVNRFLLSREQSYDELIDRTHQDQINAQLYQDLPFDRLVDEIEVEKDPSSHPVFQVMFGIQNFVSNNSDGSQYLKPFQGNVSYEVEKFDLSFFIDDSKEELTGQLGYATSLFHQDTITRMITHYTSLLTQLVSTPDKPYSELSLLGADEYDRVVHEWNETEADYPVDKMISELFEEQVAKTPDNVALVYEGEELSYRELNEKSNQLARHIRMKYKEQTGEELKSDTLIGLYLDRSLEMVIGILAVLKAGGAYVPLSPDYPEERIKYMLDDSSSKLLITEEDYVERLQGWLGGSVTLLLPGDVSTEVASDNLEVYSGPEDLAYVIYTSGTTGRPKGVMIQHRSVVSLICSDHFSEITNDDVFLHHSNPNFDAATFELWGALLNGSKLVVSRGDISSSEGLKRILLDQGITVLWMTRSLFDTIYLHEKDLFQSLNYLLVGGESLTPAIIRELSTGKSSPSHLLNGYGPTEGTTFTTTFDCDNVYDSSVPIGNPINTRKAYVLDSNNAPVPVGVPGELYIGGAGLARGYLNNAELTSERFIANPFATESDREKGYTRLYKTGDMVRWLADGNLEFLGRRDSQVKIRGYRIELGEVESVLGSQPGVNQCVVVDLDREDGEKYLVGYVVSAGGSLDVEDLRSGLQKELPDYMVPSVLMELAELPLTINGKLDRKGLPDPVFKGAGYVSPRNELEAQLCKIWEELLGLERVGIEDNFFRLGGNSIIAIKLLGLVRRELGLDMDLSLLFTHKTIGGLSSELVSAQRASIAPKGLSRYALSHAQERLLFIEGYEGGSSAYHIPYLVELSESADVDRLFGSINEVANRHKILKTIYVEGGDGVFYQELLEGDLLVERSEFKDKDSLLDAVEKEVHRPFDLSRERSLRLYHYRVEGVDYVLFLFHHISFDGWSVDIFLKDLSLAYAGLGSDGSFRLPLLDISYGDYSVWQRDYLRGDVLETLLSYWRVQLDGYEVLDLPTDYVRPVEIDYSGCNHGLSLDAGLTKGLRALSRDIGTTLNTVLLSGFYVTLHKLTGQMDLLVGSPSDNRHYAETQDMIGFFVNSLVLRLDMAGVLDVEELIGRVHEVVSGAKIHQDLPFEQLVSMLDVERDRSRHPLFQVMFELQSFDHGESLIGSLPFMPVDEGEALAYSPAKHDLGLFLTETSEEIAGVLNYARSLFKPSTIERIVRMYEDVLRGFVEDRHRSIATIDLLLPSERELLSSWNETDADYPADKTIHELFEEQVEKTPDNVALVYEGEELSYRELNARSNQLARRIRREYRDRTGEELSADTLVSLYLDRSLEMVVGILGVLKAGGAYVPMDIDYPQDRIDDMLEDTGSAIILTQSYLTRDREVVLPSDKLVSIDLTESLYAEEDTSNLVGYSQSTDLAYVIYTSGTTGRPKGVMVEHKGIVNLVENQIKCFDIRRENVVLQFASYVFDASVFEVFPSLTIGAQLSIISSSIRQDAELLRDYLDVHRVQVVTIPPSVLEVMPYNTLPALKTLIVAGESCTLRLIEKWSKDRMLINAYGPTENTVCASMHKYAQGDLNNNIGKPLDNVKLYVLDASMSLVPVGVVGELHIGGAGLARGYLNNAELTSERFIANPFATESDREKGYTRLYKTGDMVRWLADGNLEFLGRRDSQVKIRGYRIELGEVESVLGSQPGVNQCVVVDLDREQGEKYLVGYVVSAGGSLDVEDLRSGLQKELPDYMVPSVLMELAELPLTINGKLDRKGLPDPVFKGAEYVSPRNELETLICKIWEDVLGLERVGVQDDFLKIGGNSILAIRATHLMSESLDVEISIADLFEYKTPSRIVEESIGRNRIRIPKVHSTSADLSFAQERLWFIEKYDQEVSAYHIPFLLELNAGVDVSGVKHALEQIVLRHEVLRSTIDLGDDGEGIQVVHDAPLLIEEEHLSIREDYEKAISVEMGRSFNLKEEYPLRVKFYHIKSEVASDGTEKVLLLFNLHHVAGDGWSAGILQKELIAYYEAYVGGDKGFSLPSLGIQYKDYAVWQRGYLSGEVLEQQLSYWKDKLSGFETLELPTDYSRPIQIDYKGAQRNFSIDRETSAGLRALAMKHGTTLHAVMLSSLGILLSKYSNQNDIVIGSPIANRQYEQTKDLVGFFVNTQVNRLLLDKDQSYADLIVQTQRDQIKAQQYQDLPFERLVDELRVERDLSRNPIFQVMFDVHSYGPASNEGDQHFKHFQGDVSYSVEKFDLSIFIEDGHDELLGSISYATSLFHEDTINRMITHYTSLLTQLVSTPDKPYSELSLLGADEYDRVVHEWNETDADYPADKTIHELFEAQVEKTPDNVALVYEGEELSYRELNEKSNQLARHIRMKYKEQTGEELKSDTLIGMYLDRSLEMVIGIMAVLKAGGAYVPLSPDYPEERVKYMLDDSSSKLLITEEDYVERLQGWLGGSVMLLLPGDVPTEMASDNLEGYSGPEDLAYVIYTSGTTGRPKGVIVEHRSVVSFAYKNRYVLKEVKHVASFSEYSFDGFVFDLFCTLQRGACVYLFDKNTLLDHEVLGDELKKQEIDTFFVTTALFNQLTLNGVLGDLRLKNVLFGGEKVDFKTVKKALLELGDASLVHVYGPTETVVFSSAYHFDSAYELVPIGSSLHNKRLYVLDTECQPVPIGVPGELYIGGAGLARGYLNNAELTSERFIANPFATESDKEKGYTRLYKTGDMVRWLADGNLEFLGRRDSQVKIRGYRIELGEVESVLGSQPGVNQCVVVDLDREQGEKYLVGYVVSAGGSFDVEDLRSGLQKELPDYMVPSVLMELAELPLTINGKLDRKGLPDPVFKGAGYVSPRNELEAQLCKIWEELLGLERVGIEDNFFRLGGNSIIAIKLLGLVRRELGLDMDLSLLFTHKTIGGLSSELVSAQRASIAPKGLSRYALSYAQERLLFIEGYEGGSSAYHIPHLVELSESADVERLFGSINEVANRHKILKTIYVEGGDGVFYQELLEGDLLVERSEFKDKDSLLDAVEKEVHRPFDLSRERSLRLYHYRVEGVDYVLFLFHHISFDGWSVDIFLKDLSLAYAGLGSDGSFRLPLLDISYGDYSVWQRDYLRGDGLETLLSYWRVQLDGYEVLDLPTDYVRPVEIDYSGCNHGLSLDAGLTKGLRALSRDIGTTLNTVLLSGFYVTLHKLTGQMDLLVGSPSDNRHYAETQDMIGFFVNSLVLRLDMAGVLDVEELIGRVHEVVSGAKIHQDLPFEQLVSMLDVERDRSRHPLFQVMFELQSFDHGESLIGSLPFMPVDEGEALAYSPAKHDLGLFLTETSEEIAGVLNYARSLFKPSTIERIVRMYEDVLRGFVEDRHRSIATIDLLLPSERELLSSWNETDADYPADKTIHELFEEQVEKTPDNVALVYEGEELSYRELNEKSNQLARHIRTKYKEQTGEELKSDTLIGLYVDRSLEMVIGIMAVLKAGGAYVPLSPDYPEERIKYIISETGAQLLLSQKFLGLSSSVNLSDTAIINIDLSEELYLKEKRSNIGSFSKPSDLAYVIYTSGTTGKPKGVMVDHSGIVNRIEWMQSTYPLNAEDVVLHKTPYIFDVSVWELLWANWYGARIVLAKPGGHKDGAYLYGLIEEACVTILHFVPSMLSAYNHFLAEGELEFNHSIRHLFCSGEVLSEQVVADTFSKSTASLMLHNLYGPTEASVDVTYYHVERNKKILIGRPIQNTKAYVLDSNNAPVPVGAPGELYIGGAGLARGYLNNAELTSERFIANPFATESDREKGYTRLYKTGDMVRWLADGNLEFLGRRDSQVKIRGYRIELGEVEHSLSKVPGIKQCCVLALERKTGSEITKYLAGYYVLDEGVSLLEEDIRRQLLADLPDYMVPSVLMELAELPLTINGKLDRKGLPDPVFKGAGYVSPRNELEAQLCKIWEEALGINKVGLTDDFFEIGGNSILATHVSYSMRKVLGNNIQVADIFVHRNIRSLLKNTLDTGIINEGAEWEF